MGTRSGEFAGQQVLGVSGMKSVFRCMGFFVWLCSRSLVCAQCSTCLEGKCYNTGECVLGCVAGYLDKYCHKTCPSNCLNASCHTDRSTGVITCSNGCVPGYCGPKCLSVCPTGCVTCDRQCNTCNVTQCPEGRYGANCSQTCDPNYEKCDRESGNCIRCRRGYYGDNCDKRCTTCFTKVQDVMFSCQSGCDRCRSEAAAVVVAVQVMMHRRRLRRSGYPEDTSIIKSVVLLCVSVVFLVAAAVVVVILVMKHRGRLKRSGYPGDTFVIFIVLICVFVVCLVAAAVVVVIQLMKHRRRLRRRGHAEDPPLTLSAERVNKKLKIDDGDIELTNMANSGKMPGQVSMFGKTCSSPIHLHSHNSQILGDQFTTFLEEKNRPVSPGAYM